MTNLSSAPEYCRTTADRQQRLMAQTGRWKKLLDSLEEHGTGLIMTMGKGGVGKTSMAVATASELALRGYSVHLSTTDPAAHIRDMLDQPLPNLQVSRIDPKEETRKYVENIFEGKKGTLSDEDMALLEEELRSPCIEEIAVFRAFAHAVALGQDHFIVLDSLHRPYIAPAGRYAILSSRNGEEF